MHPFQVIQQPDSFLLQQKLQHDSLSMVLEVIYVLVGLSRLSAVQERSRLEAGVGKELWAEDGALGAPFFGSRVEKLVTQSWWQRTSCMSGFE